MKNRLDSKEGIKRLRKVAELRELYRQLARLKPARPGKRTPGPTHGGFRGVPARPRRRRVPMNIGDRGELK